MNQSKMVKWCDLDSRIISCRKCERLVNWREHVAITRKKAYRDCEYWGRPVPGFGDHQGRILAVGLAPGAHGSNRTGRMFTGDSSGNFLYRVLFDTGFANQPDSTNSEDGLDLNGLFISAVCRCVPPQNKPLPSEIRNCSKFLDEEITLLDDLRVIVALGRIAFDHICEQLIRGTGLSYNFPFGHGKVYQLPGGSLNLIASYHPSRQNTQTGRLTEPMFKEIWVKARKFLN